AFPPGNGPQLVSDDIGQAADGFLVAARDPAGSPGCHVSEGRADIPDTIRNPPRGGWVVLGDESDLLLDVVQGRAGPGNRPLHAFPARFASAASITAWSSAMASSWDTTRPAAASAMPRRMPSMISNSRST